MFGTFIKTAIRQLLSNRLVFTIDILVISVMVTCCLLIGVQVIKQYNFDQFHTKADRIVRVDYIYKDSQNRYHDEGLMEHSYYDDFREDLPQVINSTRYRSCWEWIKQEDNSIKVKLAFVDSAFLEMFDFRLLEGDKSSVLDDPNNIVMTSSTAEKLTGVKENFAQLIGQIITLPNTEQKEFTITGILQNVSDQSSLDFDVLLSYPHSAWYPRSTSGMGDTYVFLEIDQVTNIQNAEDGINGSVDNYFGEKISEGVEAGYLSPDQDVLRFDLRPLSSLYLDNSVSHHYLKSTDVKELTMIRYVAIIIFILAILNHLTLNLSLSVRRTGELTIKRVIGARKINLFYQFLTEAGLVGLLSIAIGIIIFSWSTPWVNTWYGWELNFKDLLAPQSIILTGLIFVGILILSCITLFMKLVVKPGFGLRSGKIERARLSTGFTVFQYCISFILITSAIFVFRQLEFMRTKELGFNEEGVMVIGLPDSFSEELRGRFKDLLTNHSSIQSIATSDRDFVFGSQTWDMPLPGGREIKTRAIRIENEYVKTLGLTLLEGSDLDPDRVDQPEILVNEAFVKQSGIENPIGHIIDHEIIDGTKFVIGGVVKDFHFDAVSQSIKPLVLTNAHINGIWNVFVRYNEGRLEDARLHIESVWKEVEPTLPLRLSFMDEKMDSRYKKEERFGRVITSASIVAILITAFGLFSLSMITLTTRIKEIGIRKANGAQSLDIYSQFVKKYFKWVLISIAIGIPVSWYLMDTWLQNFPYRTSIDWWVFALAGLMALGIALLTVSWQSWKAATRNPVEALRYE
ncbi:MAG: ABC transporter permease [Cyclobacteriaceae bacterium]|nr:ABC transporter permease [Cyclobacteriaceae bacterium SS2]